PTNDSRSSAEWKVPIGRSCKTSALVIALSWLEAIEARAMIFRRMAAVVGTDFSSSIERCCEIWARASTAGLRTEEPGCRRNFHSWDVSPPPTPEGLLFE